MSARGPWFPVGVCVGGPLDGTEIALPKEVPYLMIGWESAEEAITETVTVLGRYEWGNGALRGKLIWSQG